MKRVELKKLEDIAKVLQDNISLEEAYIPPYGNGMYYFVHIKANDFSFAKSCGEDTESFASFYKGEIKDDSYDWESLDNEDFKAVCVDLLEQVNSYISEEMKWAVENEQPR